MTNKKKTPTSFSIKNDAKKVLIEWSDGHKSSIPINYLRGYCPCASCQGHQGEIRWIQTEVYGIKRANMVGRYAISFEFLDGHSLGIYRFSYLRDLEDKEKVINA